MSSEKMQVRTVLWVSTAAAVLAGLILIVPNFLGNELLRELTKPDAPTSPAPAATALHPSPASTGPAVPSSSPGPAATAPAAPGLAALHAFSHPGELAWGAITMGAPRHHIEQTTGALQCRPRDHQGYSCACQGTSEGVEFLVEFRNPQTAYDAEVCRRPDVRPATLAVLLTQAEQSLSHQEIVGALGERLPSFRRVRGPEPSGGDERSRFKPVYTFGDGAYNLIVDYEWTAIRVVHSSVD